MIKAESFDACLISCITYDTWNRLIVRYMYLMSLKAGYIAKGNKNGLMVLRSLTKVHCQPSMDEIENFPLSALFNLGE